MFCCFAQLLGRTQNKRMRRAEATLEIDPKNDEKSFLINYSTQIDWSTT